jgi:hypothetical protein
MAAVQVYKFRMGDLLCLLAADFYPRYGFERMAEHLQNLFLPF